MKVQRGEGRERIRVITIERFQKRAWWYGIRMSGEEGDSKKMKEQENSVPGWPPLSRVLPRS